jgi:UDP-N-acetylmuramate dehydrogenase
MIDLKKQLPGLKLNQPLAEQTTFGIGGPAEYFYLAKTTADLIKAVKTARQNHLAFIVLGNASNVLVPDKGIKGLVIKNQTSQIKVLSTPPGKLAAPQIPARFKSLDKSFQDMAQLEYDESKYPPILVEMDSGVFLPKAIFSLINQGITGLEWFAGIPATIGGACYINLHGGHKFFSDYLFNAKILTKANQVKTVPPGYFQFSYDQSKLKTKKEIVLSATLRLYRGPKEKALKIAQAWAEKKSHQPQRSAGCIFRNLSQAEQKKLGLPTSSIGYLMDKVLKLKGKTIGQARISPKHAGFIENLGGARAKDVIQLIKLMKQTAKKKLNLNLKLEIVCLN